MYLSKYPWVSAAIAAVWIAGSSVIIFRSDEGAEYILGLILFTTVLLVAIGFRSPSK